MDAVTTTGTFAPAAWQPILDAYPEYFANVDPRLRMGFIPRAAADAQGDAAPVVSRRSAPLPMLVWQADGRTMVASQATFEGLDGLDADLLFVASDGALEAVLRFPHDVAFCEMKRRIRSGDIQLFVLRSREALRERGYEDFLEHLGLPFLGACR
jgi:hypothetical protein